MLGEPAPDSDRRERASQALGGGPDAAGGRYSRYHPLQALAGPSGARSAVSASAFELAGYSLYTHPVYPPWYIHPVYPGPIPTLYPPAVGTMSTRADTANSQFWTPVGEPRGIRTQPVSGSQGWFILYMVFTRPFDWVYGCFDTVLLSLGPVLLSFRHCFTEFRTCFTEFWSILVNSRDLPHASLLVRPQNPV